MTTKKQKREAGLAKRAEFEAKEKERGLEALRLDREERERRSQIRKAEGEKINDRMLETLAKALYVGRNDHNGNVEAEAK